jgi:class 3 adenylate cyclase
MSETRKLAAILVADVVGYSRLAGADEERTLARLRGLRSDLIDPAIAGHHGRIVKRTGDGSIIEFRSVVDAVRCAIEVQNGMVERNAGLSPERRIEFRVGIHLGDVVEESDGDLMGDGVNIAARLEGVAKPGAICLSEDAYRQVKQRLDLKVSDLGPTQLKNIAEPMRIYSLEVGPPAQAKLVEPPQAAPRKFGRIAALVVAGILASGAAMMLRPTDWYYINRGEHEFANGHPREAIESFTRVGKLTQEAQALLIASYIDAGMDKEARAEARALLKRSPKFSVNAFLEQARAAAIVEDSSRLKDALVAAGLPAEVGWECLVRDSCR